MVFGPSTISVPKALKNPPLEPVFKMVFTEDFCLSVNRASGMQEGTPTWKGRIPKGPEVNLVLSSPAFAVSPVFDFKIKDLCNLGEKDVGNFKDTEDFLGITNSDIVNKMQTLKSLI